jgi:D-3-phosphoglycerate dehydrogenase / 2-oxoglutarate reductase
MFRGSKEWIVALTEPLSETAEAVLKEKVHVARFSDLSEDTLAREIRGVDAVIIRAKGRLTKRVLAASDRLRVIGRHGTGVDHIDIDTAKELGITVVNTDANCRAVAEFTVGVMLSVARRILQGDRIVREEAPWHQADKLVGFELHRRNIGIVGIGRIGRMVGRICTSGFGANLLYYDHLEREWPSEDGVAAERCSLDDLLQASDIVSIHVPLTASTDRLLDSRRLALFKPGSILINTSRGRIIDEAALIAALEKGAIGGAALDVMEQEPLIGSRLQSMSNVVLTPHMAAFTVDAVEAMGAVVLDVLRVLAGEAPRWKVC